MGNNNMLNVTNNKDNYDDVQHAIGTVRR